MSSRRWVILAVAVLLGIIAGGLVYNYVQGVEDDVNEEARRVEVYKVVANVPKGTFAEDAFANLLDLELRPRRMRDASAMWAALHSRLGAEGRDGVWSHPDLLPSSEELGDWQAWVDGYVARGEGDDVDREIERLLGSDGA
ncbi:MAG: zinc-dependent metalloprotease [Actinomycetes bacterium]|nr:zinc-dependent metalloprotease [Actinomycetes bacterium]MDX5450087.1 zinc-dependent metalloprotease [Actinomycetes bacterium]